MAARSNTKTSKSKKTSRSSASKKTASSSGIFDSLSLSQARHVLEASYTLHLFLLLVMTVLAALLLWIVVKQQYTIKSLDFQVRFMRERYEQTRDWNGELLEYKSNGGMVDGSEDEMDVIEVDAVLRTPVPVQE